jgi:NodT family efflux transporter outer membrane factor (OMF) lipoprotein
MLQPCRFPSTDGSSRTTGGIGRPAGASSRTAGNAPRPARGLVAFAAIALAACATPPAPPSSGAGSAAPGIAGAPASAWQAPLPAPHGGSPAELARWWGQFDDALLPDLIDAAQAASPTLAAARARIEDARATAVAAGAALQPRVDAVASAGRGKQDLRSPLATSLTGGLQAAWELDLFGAGAAARDAAQARLAGAAASWHDARVSLAAEVANLYVQLRACEAQRQQAETDARSREQSERLTELSARAGFQAPSAAALARASAAQGRAQLAAQRAQCDVLVKSLVALTARDEAALRGALAASTGRLPQPAQIGISALPAQLLAQRPDVRQAELDLRAAVADRRQADADRLPRIALVGTIGAAAARSGGETFRGSTWTIGPLSVTLPILDGGTRAARSAAAEARELAAVTAYQARLREALREVEQALVQLASTAARSVDAQIAAAGFEASFRAAETRQQGGLASLFELEDARRTAVAANTALIDLQRERVAAWIGLYRAAGGGWSPDQPAPPSLAASRSGDPSTAR